MVVEARPQPRRQFGLCNLYAAFTCLRVVGVCMLRVVCFVIYFLSCQEICMKVLQILQRENFKIREGGELHSFMEKYVPNIRIPVGMFGGPPSSSFTSSKEPMGLAKQKLYM